MRWRLNTETYENQGVYLRRGGAVPLPPPMPPATR